MSVCPFWAAVETRRHAGRGSCLNIITISHSSVYYTLKKGRLCVIDRMDLKLITNVAPGLNVFS